VVHHALCQVGVHNYLFRGNQEISGTIRLVPLHSCAGLQTAFGFTVAAQKSNSIQAESIGLDCIGYEII
jgi:hypothetical protein